MRQMAPSGNGLYLSVRRKSKSHRRRPIQTECSPTSHTHTHTHTHTRTQHQQQCGKPDVTTKPPIVVSHCGTVTHITARYSIIKKSLAIDNFSIIRLLRRRQINRNDNFIVSTVDAESFLCHYPHPDQVGHFFWRIGRPAGRPAGRWSPPRTRSDRAALQSRCTTRRV